MIRAGVWAVLALLLIVNPVFAEEEDEAVDLDSEAAAETTSGGELEVLLPEEETGELEEEEKATPTPRRPVKGARGNESETQGTKARNRFGFGDDTIPKSRYQLNGQPLEVDPD